MEGAENMEWSKAQQIRFSVNLDEAAKQQLHFLVAVDSTGCLYDGPLLDRAIDRYKYCWLPLLAKHMECSVVDGPLVVPLDCEWIWHCHRLNPLQYKRDCEEIFGRILDNMNVLSTVGGTFSKPTESIWNKIYVSEPFHLDLDNVQSQFSPDGVDKSIKTTEYDLVAAVKRQSSFFSKVSKVISYSDRFLEEAVARYKSFLHLSKTLMERNIKSFCVPTHDIDLIWHTHQLYPVAYCSDLMPMFGKVVDHNDRDSGSSESGKNNLEDMFLRTKKLWENVYGCMYCVRGATQQKAKGGVARCCMDHVPGLGASGTRSCYSEDIADCFKTCSLKAEEKCPEDIVDCFKTCSLKAEEKCAEDIVDCFKTCSLKAEEKCAEDIAECFKSCIINCYLGAEGTKMDVKIVS